MRKVHCWLREAQRKAKSSTCSFRSNRSVSKKGSMNSKITRHLHESRSSGTSRKTRPSKSSKDREIKEKVEVAELMAEAELLLQRYIIENEAGKLKIKKKLLKSRAKIQDYNNTDLENGIKESSSNSNH